MIAILEDQHTPRPVAAPTQARPASSAAVQKLAAGAGTSTQAASWWLSDA